MDLVTYNLVSLDTAKDYLGITNSEKDEVLKMLINQATDYIERKCNRRFAKTTYTNEEYDGTQSYELSLNQFPITTFTKLEVNNNTDNSDDWEEIDSENYWVDTDTGIITKTTIFGKGKNRYRATYEAGYDTIPYDLQLACLMLVSENLNKRKASGVKSESLGDHSITFESIIQQSGTLKEIIANYKNVIIR